MITYRTDHFGGGEAHALEVRGVCCEILLRFRYTSTPALRGIDTPRAERNRRSHADLCHNNDTSERDSEA